MGAAPVAEDARSSQKAHASGGGASGYSREVAQMAIGDPTASVALLESPEGQRLVGSLGVAGQRSWARWQRAWEAQQSGAFCAPASVFAALRFFGVHGNWSQHRLYDEVIVPRGLMTRGISFSAGAALARAVGFQVEERSCADEAELARLLLRDMQDAFEDGGELCLLVNYVRASGGHWSPLAAFAQDHVLIMDTNPQRLPHHWVPLSSLVRSLCLHNQVTGTPRGYLSLRLPARRAEE
eukprot:CAMPEP_0203951342 /NCGR_PEP_ID=MMETSP0359-20131031/85266_1 /ASSEMBLY_ACC=CAM_ASM_000338 /TAXON_ID=268821 /ORGANISM="Scrippsiella Hangoei, Strain SHTV-5" /LENGTH=238 /DNA_ID=CAMNT_0050883925 /DNA_START=18 /DNA_END=732 /DNA_ORIENTATION=+